jgi:glycerol-3-phosphate acyltransferase PlsY
MIQILSSILLIPFYLLGSFPTGVLIARLNGFDITAHGSGNVGATNVARVVGKRAGLFTLVGDMAKGLLGVLIASACTSSQTFVAAAGAAVVAGHCFSVPPFLRGGKGVATSFGVIVALSWVCALVALAVFGAVFAVTRIVSLSSLCSAIVVPLTALLINLPDATCVAFIVIAMVVVIRHKENVQRLVEGREPRFQVRHPSDNGTV